MNNFLKFIFGTILSLSLFSCVESEELKSDTPLNQTYTAIYNSTTQEIEVNSILNTKNGAFVKLGNGTSLTCNDIKYDYIIGFYTWGFNKLQDLNFELKKEDGTILRNEIAKSDFKNIDISNNITSLTKGQENTISWTGESLRNNEEVSIAISQLNNDTIEIFTVDTNDDKIIKLNKNILDNFNKGEATIRISRSFSKDLDQDDQKAGGNKYIVTEVSKEINIK